MPLFNAYSENRPFSDRQDHKIKKKKLADLNLQAIKTKQAKEIKNITSMSGSDYGSNDFIKSNGSADSLNYR